MSGADQEAIISSRERRSSSLSSSCDDDGALSFQLTAQKQPHEALIFFSADNHLNPKVCNRVPHDDDDERTLSTTASTVTTVLTTDRTQEQQETPVVPRQNTPGSTTVRATKKEGIQPQRQLPIRGSSHSACSSNSNPKTSDTIRHNQTRLKQKLERSASVRITCNGSKRLARKSSSRSVCSASSEQKTTTTATPPQQQHPRPRRKGSARSTSSNTDKQQQQQQQPKPERGSVSPSQRRGRVLRQRSLRGDAQLHPKLRQSRSLSKDNDGDPRQKNKSCDLDSHFVSSDASKHLKRITSSNASLIDYYSSDDDNNSCVTTSTCESRKDHYASMLKNKKKKRGKAAIEEIKTSLSMAASVTSDTNNNVEQLEGKTCKSAPSLEKYLLLQPHADNNNTSNHSNSFSVDGNSKGKARLLQKLRNELVSHPSSKQGLEIVGNVETTTKIFIQPKSATATAPLITSEKASSIPTTTTTRVQCPQEQREHQGNSKDSNKPRRITKLEKIEQLQNENLKCREEFKVVYQERNELRKSVELKQKQIVDLQKSVEEYGIQNGTLVESMQKVTNELLEVKEKQKEMSFALETECNSSSTMKEDLMKALKLINSHKSEIIQLRDILSRKDEQITKLLNESANQTTQIQKAQVVNPHSEINNTVTAISTWNKEGSDSSEEKESDVSECPSVSAMRSGYGKMTQIIREGEDKVRILEEENERLKLEKENEILLKEKSNQMLLDEIEKLKKENCELRSDLKETQDNAEKQKEDAIDDMNKKLQEFHNKYDYEIKELNEIIEKQKKEQSLTEYIQQEDNIKSDYDYEIDIYKQRLRDSYNEIIQLNKDIEEKEDEISNLLYDVDDLNQENNRYQQQSQQEEKKTSNDYYYRQHDTEKELKEAIDLINEKESTIRQLEIEIRKYRNKADELSLPNELDDEVQNKSTSEMLKLQEEQIDTLKKDNKLAVEQIKQLKVDIERSQLVIKERNNAYEDLLKEIEHYKHNNEVETGHEIQKLSDMVAAREDAIAELLKECDELRGQLDEADQQQLEEGSKNTMLHDNEVVGQIKRGVGNNKHSDSDKWLLENEVEQHKKQAQALLEEVADLTRQNDILSEEVEEWIARGNDMEMLIEELRADIGALKEAAAIAQSSSEVKKANLIDNEVSKKQIDNEVPSTHQLDVGGIVRGFGNLLLSEKNENGNNHNNAKRIKELEEIKESQERLIENLKTDIKKLGIAFRNEMNKSKSSMMMLAGENKDCQRKLKEIERKNIELQELLFKQQQDNMTESKHA